MQSAGALQRALDFLKLAAGEWNAGRWTLDAGAQHSALLTQHPSSNSHSQAQGTEILNFVPNSVAVFVFYDNDDILK